MATAVAERPEVLAAGARERLSYIDGLRAVAAIGVVFCHTEMVNPTRAAHALLDAGHGVDLFFVLSGFCLSFPTLRNVYLGGIGDFDVVRFAVRRIIRILPPYYIATVLLLVVALLSWRFGGPFTAPGAAPLKATDVLGQFLMLDRAVNLSNPTYWTLIVEMRWYLVFPALLALWLRAPRAFLALLLLIYIAYFFTRENNLDFGTLPAFMLGIVAADVGIRQHAFRKVALPLVFCAAAAAVLLEPFIDAHAIIWQTNPGWAFAAFCAVVAAGDVRWLRRALSGRLIAFLGVASYSIYLMHYPIVMALGPLLPHNVGAFFATVLAAILGGLLFYVAAEQWFCGGVVRAWLYARLEPCLRLAGTWLAGACIVRRPIEQPADLRLPRHEIALGALGKPPAAP